MKKLFIIVAAIFITIGCTKGGKSSGIYSHLIANNLLYRFSFKSISFDKVESYLKENQQDIESIYLSILVPTPKDGFTEMISIDMKDIKLSENQKINFVEKIGVFLQEKSEVENPQLAYDILLKIKLNDQSGVTIKMETKTHEEWNSITYEVYDKSIKSFHSVRRYKIVNPIGLQKFLAEFTLSLKGNENSRGVERLREIWPEIHGDPTFLNQDSVP